MEGGEATSWLMTIEHGTSLAAAVVDNRWLRPGIRSWTGGHDRWDVFARLRNEQRRGITLMAALHVTPQF
jgi:hypothetical protein